MRLGRPLRCTRKQWKRLPKFRMTRAQGGGEVSDIGPICIYCGIDHDRAITDGNPRATNQNCIDALRSRIKTLEEALVEEKAQRLFYELGHWHKRKLKQPGTSISLSGWSALPSYEMTEWRKRAQAALS